MPSEPAQDIRDVRDMMALIFRLSENCARPHGGGGPGVGYVVLVGPQFICIDISLAVLSVLRNTLHHFLLVIPWFLLEAQRR
jgi:hypothetical protein